MEPFVLALDFGGTKTALATAAQDRSIIAQVKLPTRAENTDSYGAEQVLQHALAAAHQLIETTKQMTGGSLVGIGVSSMGITLPDGVMMAPNVPGWEQLRLEATIQAEFPQQRIAIDNDVKVAAYAELRRGALAGSDTGLYVNLGTGIAVTFTLGDRIIRGHHGAAGEIAYCLRRSDVGAGYQAGSLPLEQFVGGGNVGERASQTFGRPMTAMDVFQQAHKTPVILAFRNEILDEIAFQLTNLIIAWNPQKVAIGGGFMAEKNVILPHLAEWFEKFAPFPPLLCEAQFSRDASLHGAIELGWANLESAGPTEKE